MNNVKAVLIEQDTQEKLRLLDDMLRDDQADAASAVVSYEDEALARVHSVQCGWMPPHGHAAHVPDDVYTDAEMFRPYLVDKAGTALVVDQQHSLIHESVYAAIDRTQLKGGRRYMQAVLRHPLRSAADLVNRQTALDKLEQVYTQHKETVDGLLKRAAMLERHALWMYRHVDDELQSLHDIAFFRTFLFDRLNGSGVALTALNFYKILASPVIGIMSPVIYFMLPYLIMRIRFGIRVPFRTYLLILWRSVIGGAQPLNGPGGASWMKSISLLFSMVFYFQSLFTSLEVSSTLQKICNVIVGKVQAMENFFSVSQQILQILWMPSIVKPWFCDPEGGGQERVPDYSTNTRRHTNESFCIFSNFGEQLKNFRTFDRSAHGVVMNRIHAMSALLSILSIKKDAGFCSARFDATDPRRPSFSASHLWHPCLDRAQAVHNNVVAGRAHPPGILLTGPNAGGKSTLLKSAIICVMLAQSLTIAPAKTCHLTPFAFINSHMNVPDCKGMASLFEAEMRRAKQYIDSVKHMRDVNRSAFIVMDELFSSTNPIEGIAGAYSVAKQLVAHDHCICIVSTHFTYLAKLASSANLYSNWQMPVQISANGDIEYPYKLKRGVCRQYIALDILQRNGFDADIIHDAQCIKQDLLEKKPTSTRQQKQLLKVETATIAE